MISAQNYKLIFDNYEYISVRYVTRHYMILN